MDLSRSVLRSKWPIILWGVFIFCLHIIPSEKIPQPPDWNISFDKIVHFILFAVFSFLLLGLFDHHRKRNRLVLPVVILVSFIYGFLMESAQILVPGRQFHMLDIVADSAGVIAGIFAYWGLFRPQKS